ncbi:unnamed protein product [Rotaria magnacalcarata]
MKILRGISSLSSDSSTFLKAEELTDKCIMLQCDIVSLSNEIQVLKPMLKQSKSKDVVDLFFEFLPLEQAFPTIIYLAIGALTMPVCLTTTERTFKVINVPSSAPNTSLSSSSATPLPPTITSKTRVTTTALLPPTAITTAAPQPIITTTTIANHNPLKPLSGMSFVPALNLLTSYDFSIVTNISALDTFKMAEHYSSQLLIFDLLRRRMMNTY